MYVLRKKNYFYPTMCVVFFLNIAEIKWPGSLKGGNTYRSVNLLSFAKVFSSMRDTLLRVIFLKFLKI